MACFYNCRVVERHYCLCKQLAKLSESVSLAESDCINHNTLIRTYLSQNVLCSCSWVITTSCLHPRAEVLFHFTTTVTAKAIKHTLISTLCHSQSHSVGEGRKGMGMRWTEMVRMCHLSSFSHFSEIGVTNRRMPFVSRRIATGFLSGLATLIRGVEQAEREQHLSWKGQRFNDTFTNIQYSTSHILHTHTHST